MRPVYLYIALLSIFFLRTMPATLLERFKNFIGKGLNKAYNGILSMEISSEFIEKQCVRRAEALDLHDETPNINKMKFHYITACCTYSVPILLTDNLWRIPKFRQNRKLVLVASGWRTTYNNSDTIKLMSKAFLCRPEVNFVAVDAHNYVDMVYSWSAINANYIGNHIGYGLMRLTIENPSIEIHLIGHSLGTHILAFAARRFRELTGRPIDRITGLDPARPCFEKTINSQGLARGDAQFIDVIHTNPGVLGVSVPIGDIDFYPGGSSPIQSGCLFIECSHKRSIEYFTESIYPGQEKNFVATKCASMEDLGAKACNLPTTLMGYMVNHNDRGIYYIKVNSKSPYGMDANSATAIELVNGDDQCRCKGFQCSAVNDDPNLTQENNYGIYKSVDWRYSNSCCP